MPNADVEVRLAQKQYPQVLTEVTVNGDLVNGVAPNATVTALPGQAEKGSP